MGTPHLNTLELHEKLAVHFEKFKEAMMYKERRDVNTIMYNLFLEADNLLYKVNFETNEFVEDKLSEDCNSRTDAEQKKAEYLIKLQSLTAEISCQIMSDYKKKVDGKSHVQN